MGETWVLASVVIESFNQRGKKKRCLVAALLKLLEGLKARVQIEIQSALTPEKVSQSHIFFQSLKEIMSLERFPWM